MFSFFARAYHYDPDQDPELKIAIPELRDLLTEFHGDQMMEMNPLDEELRASGFKRAHRVILRKHAEGADLDELTLEEDQESNRLYIN